MNAPLLARYRERMAGVLTGCDLIVITGTRPGACHAADRTRFLNARHIRIFYDPHFTGPLGDRYRANAKKLAESGSTKIEYIAKAHLWKEDVVAAFINTGSDHPG